MEYDRCYGLMIAVLGCAAAAITYIVKKRKKGECVGCSECNRSRSGANCPHADKRNLTGLCGTQAVIGQSQAAAISPPGNRTSGGYFIMEKVINYQ